MAKSLKPLPCFKCNKELQDAGMGDHNHANDANAFSSRGQYGSRVYDPMDGSFLQINICDDCLTDAVKENKVAIGTTRIINKSDMKLWDGK